LGLIKVSDEIQDALTKVTTQLYIAFDLLESLAIGSSVISPSPHCFMFYFILSHHRTSEFGRS
jgi:hypothetical protein